MKIYISYTLGKQEEYLVSVIALKLRQEGFSLSNTTESVSSSKLQFLLTYEALTAISSSDILIGVVTKEGENIAHLYKEWDIARKNNIPLGILVEEGTKVEEKYASNVFYFKRSDLATTKSKLKERRRFYELVEYEPSETPGLNRAQRITWFTVYDVLITLLPVFANSQISVE